MISVASYLQATLPNPTTTTWSQARAKFVELFPLFHWGPQLDRSASCVEIQISGLRASTTPHTPRQPHARSGREFHRRRCTARKPSMRRLVLLGEAASDSGAYAAVTSAQGVGGAALRRSADHGVAGERPDVWSECRSELVCRKWRRVSVGSSFGNIACPLIMSNTACHFNTSSMQMYNRHLGLRV